ncbi:MAG: hypothetical protein JO323_06810 [Acidobacteriia bacterium]|nr:hypothetical protein [Terriglobia bacterium]
MKVTRRQLTASLIVAPVLAQAPAVPAGPEADLEAARKEVQAITMALSRIEVPVTTEPAFAFKA